MNQRMRREPWMTGSYCLLSTRLTCAANIFRHFESKRIFKSIAAAAANDIVHLRGRGRGRRRDQRRRGSRSLLHRWLHGWRGRRGVGDALEAFLEALQSFAQSLAQLRQPPGAEQQKCQDGQDWQSVV